MARKPLPPSAKMVFKGVIFEVWQWEQEMFDGSKAVFERLKRDNTAQAIAVVGDKILLQEQQQPDSDVFLSLPGGRCDGDEDMLAAAKRELLEETGYESDDWELWSEIHPVAKIEWAVSTYIARNCRKVAEPHLDPGERITNKLISFDEFLALSDDPNFRSPEIIEDLLRMRLDTTKLEECKTRLFGTHVA